MQDLSVSLYGSKHKWKKILENGLTTKDEATKQEVGSRYGKRLLYIHKTKYFTLNSLMEYMVAELKKNEEVAKKLEAEKAAVKNVNNN